MIDKIIYMNNGAIYYISKYTKKFSTKVELLCIIQLVQSLDLNYIKNYQYINKIQVCSYYYNIYLIKEIKVVINDEYKKLTEKN